MRVANAQLMYPFRPVTSISEFSSVAGAPTNHMMLVLCVIQWVMLMTLFASEVQNNSGDFLTDGGNIIMMIGSALLCMVGFFEMNRRDHGMLLLHCVGFFAVSMIFPIATMLQCDAIHQQDSAYWPVWVIPIVCMCISWPCMFAWCYIGFSPANMEQFEKGLMDHIEHGGSCEEYLEEARPKMNRLALKCLVLEMAVIYGTILMAAVYIANWASWPQCSFGCRNACSGCEHWC